MSSRVTVKEAAQRLTPPRNPEAVRKFIDTHWIEKRYAAGSTYNFTVDWSELEAAYQEVVRRGR